MIKIELEHIIHFLGSNITFEKKNNRDSTLSKNLNSSQKLNQNTRDSFETVLKFQIENLLQKNSQSTKKVNYSQSKQNITIGRTNNCDIYLEGEEISKTHCLISFNQTTKRWVVHDGNLKKKSFNGVWLFLFDAIELPQQKSVFKHNKCIFSIEYFNNNNDNNDNIDNINNNEKDILIHKQNTRK